MRRALFLSAVVVLALGTAGAALATSGTGAGGDFVVTVSLAPDTAATDDVVTASESITNVTASWQLARITQTLTGPAGGVLRVSYPLLVPPGKTLALSLRYRVPAAVTLARAP
ncbi:MAG: hypothetical protein ACRDN6_05000 [Gaiellaceae bacterium]